MSSTNPTDLLLVNRGGSSYSVQIQDMSTIQDTDLLLINRSGTSYKIEAQDLLGGTAPLIESTSLANDDPTGPRFTGEDFTLTSTLSQNGSPVSTKKIDAYVRGTLEVSYETDSIDSVNATPASQTIANPGGGDVNDDPTCIATDGNGNWMFIHSDGQYLSTATGDIPVFGSPITVAPVGGGWSVDVLAGVAASNTGTWILTGRELSSGKAFMLRSTNFGSTWTDVTPTTAWRPSVMMSWVNTDNAGNWMTIGSASNPYLSQSSDDGQSWTNIATFSVSAGNNIGGLANYGGSWVVTLTGNGGSNGGYKRTTNFGSSWSYATFSSTANNGTNIGIQVSDTGTMITGFTNSTKINRSTNQGATWTAIETSHSGKVIAYLYGDTWIKFKENSLVESDDDGLTWQSGTVSADFYPNTGAILAQAKGVISCPGYGTVTGGSYSDNVYSNLKPSNVELGLSGTKSLNDIQVGMTTTNGASATGTVSSIDSSTPSITLFGYSGTWSTGETVITDPVVLSETILYLVFNSSGNVTDLSTTPQDPYYTTVDNPVDFTFTFPATFPTGQTPDQELPTGTTLHATVTAFNAAGVSGGAAQVTP